MGYLVLLVGLVLSFGAGFARSEEKLAPTIVRSLQPKPLTRSLSAAPSYSAKAAEETNFINGVRSRATRSLSIGEREKIATIVKDKPSIDLKINFKYNSARIGGAAAPQVNELGKALTDQTLNSNTFILSGYADGSGNASYNQTLSERRADSVKQYLVEKYKIPATTLVTVGYGSTHFKNTKDPNAAENRRVAVSNMADGKVSNNQ
jgi:outer membrane protein OmpA-like peptidoglycan-associated protein